MSAEILLVEDDTDTREVLAEFLATEGFRVAAAVNGRDALEQLRRGLRPRIILLDLTMPIMNGVEFRHQQLADEALRRIPVIITTAMPPRQSDSFAGVTVVEKPIDLDLLLTSIRSHLEQLEGCTNS